MEVSRLLALHAATDYSRIQAALGERMSGMLRQVMSHEFVGFRFGSEARNDLLIQAAALPSGGNGPPPGRRAGMAVLD